MDSSALHLAPSIPVCPILYSFPVGVAEGLPVTPEPQTTFVDTAVNEGLLPANLFTVDLKKGAPGSYDFGFIDSTKLTGSITYVP